MAAGEIEEIRKESSKSSLYTLCAALGVVIISNLGLWGLNKLFYTEEVNRNVRHFLPKQRKFIIDREDYIIKVNDCTYIMNKRTKEIMHANSKECLNKYDDFLKRE